MIVKQIPTELMGDDLKKAQNEVAILRSLDHPNVIEYYDSYIKHRTFYIVMEYACHGNLQEYIAERRPTNSYLEPQVITQT